MYVDDTSSLWSNLFSLLVCCESDVKLYFHSVLDDVVLGIKLILSLIGYKACMIIVIDL